jgi:5-methylcytosine-specific restriction endonuclease McrA
VPVLPDNQVKTQKADAERAWKALEDVVVPRLGLSLVDRAVYSHLLRHSHLEGWDRVQFTMGWLAQGTGIAPSTARHALRRLLELGAVRLVRRSNKCRTVEVRLPEEIQAALDSGDGRWRMTRTRVRAWGGLEEIDFLKNQKVRQAIHEREQGLCFYCLRRVDDGTRTLDHVVPQVEGGGNSYRNLVSCCADCNSCKAEGAADNFLRRLYREGRLTAAELSERLRALEELSLGKLRPALVTAIRPRASGNTDKSVFTGGSDRTEKQIPRACPRSAGQSGPRNDNVTAGG